MKMSNVEKGFTLVELLVVMMILSAIGAVTLTIISTSLRSTNKTNTQTNVRQNGAYAISQMTKMIRNTNKIAELGGAPFTNCVVITPPSPTPMPTLAQYSSIRITAFDGGTTTFACCPSPGATISSSSASLACSGANLVSLLDTAEVSLVPGSCYFTCTQESAIDAPKIGIKFSLNQANTNALYEKKTTVPFETSVILRNSIK